MKVSLIIPAYNVENLIEMTLKSVQNQTLKKFECIIVNDCSTDSTGKVVHNFIKNDKRFKLINHRANAGLSAARNTGLRFSKGKYIAFLDSDDLIMPESLELRSRTLDEANDTTVIGTYAGSVTIDMGCEIAPDGKDVNLNIKDFITAGGNCPFNANQPMFVKELFKNIGGFDHSLKQAEDYDMWMRVLRYGYKIVPTKKQLVTYRQTEGSMIRNNPLLHLEVSYQRFMDCYEQYPNCKFNDKFQIILKEGLGTYKAQLDIANRVLEFIGLALSKGEDIHLLNQKLNEYLPNYFDIIEGHRPFLNRVKKGIDRYFKKNVNFNDEAFKELKMRVDALYKLFQQGLKEKNDYINHNNIEYSFNNIVSIPGIQKEIDVVFFPHKDYHVYTISLLKDYFSSLDLKIIIVDISMHYRDEGVKVACEKYQLPHIGYSNFLMGNFQPKTIVSFNDWDPIVRSIMLSAKTAGIPTIGIVEGIQDYLDADTKQDRKAYRVVDHLFLPGEHDKKYFKKTNQELYVGGVPRIFDLYKKRKDIKKKEKIALINSNFSYGVLEECRDQWLTDAVNSCKKAGFKPVVSRHPADRGELYQELVTKDSFYEAVEKSTVHISRFASGILEALAMNVLPIYFNPHGEKVDKFYDSLGSYPIVETAEMLEVTLKNYEQNISSCKQYFDKFLNFHCGNPHENLSQDIVNNIKNIVDTRMQLDDKDYEVFFEELEAIDHRSGCFNNLQTIRKYNEERMNQGININNKVVTLKNVHYQIKLKKYAYAKELAEVLLAKQPENPAYKSTLNFLIQVYVK